MLPESVIKSTRREVEKLTAKLAQLDEKRLPLLQQLEQLEKLLLENTTPEPEEVEEPSTEETTPAEQQAQATEEATDTRFGQPGQPLEQRNTVLETQAEGVTFAPQNDTEEEPNQTAVA